jgi:hypothetical protein
MTVLAPDISHGQRGGVGNQGQPIPEPHSGLGAEAERRPVRFVADDLGGEGDLDETGRTAEGAVDVVPVAARAERDLRLPPVIEPGVGTYGHLRGAIDELEVVSEVDGDVGKAVAFDPAESVGELDLTSEEVLVVETAAVQPAAAGEALGEDVAAVRRAEEELGRIALHVFIAQFRSGIAESGIELARIDAEAGLALALPIAGAKLPIGLGRRRLGDGVGARHLDGLGPRAARDARGEKCRENEASPHERPPCPL